MQEEAKIIRRTAKARFTRKKNELLKSIATKSNRELVESNYAQLVDAWNILESKHDLYTMYLTDDELGSADTWITEIQDLFSEATTVKINFINDLLIEEQNVRAEAERKEAVNKEREQAQRLFDQAVIRRDTARIVFETSHQGATHVLASDQISTATVKKLQDQLEDAYTECKQANSVLLSLLTREAASSELTWLPAIQASYNEIIAKLEAQLDSKEKPMVESKAQVKTEKSSNLHLEKIRMPRFDGELREYPTFKRDFQKQVMPHLTENTAPYTLRSCLSKEPLAQVKSVDDDIRDMWERLDEKYGDPAKFADAIINDIRRIKSIKEGENRRFVEFVGIVEDGFRDLKRLGLETEITTTSSVSIIERKLPADIRKEWAKLLSSDESKINKTDKFSSLLKFLLAQKRAVEYDSSELRAVGGPAPCKGAVHYAAADEYRDNPKSRPHCKCLFHDNVEHSTNDCRLYLSKPMQERMSLLKEKGACFSCLKCGHRSRDCRKKKECGIKGCRGKHHVTLHEDKPAETEAPNVVGASSTCTEQLSDTCLLQIQKIKTPRGWVNVLWDNASSISLMTHGKAKAEKLRGKPVELSITKVGGEEEKRKSSRYELSLIDLQGKTVTFEVYGIDKITSDIQSVSIFDYAGFHPEKESSSEHLLLLRNRVGRCVGGTHPSIKESIRKTMLGGVKPAHYVKGVKIDDFYNIENLGINCTPSCGGCKCGKCAPGSNNYSLKEERELKLIEKNLQCNEQESCWIAAYPWIKDPYLLPNNKKAAFGRLLSTERRLTRNPQHAEVYQVQIEDMIERQVARKLTQKEVDNYEGPTHYISHHDVLKPDSKSTPVRIVFNSSASYMGQELNDYWAKGPDLLNNLLGILVRFRENEIGFVGDVKKMYHTVKTETIEHHTHRFLWRDMNTSR